MPARLDQRTDLNAAFVIYTVRHGVGVMLAARKTEIGDDELKQLAAYLARQRHEATRAAHPGEPAWKIWAM